MSPIKEMKNILKKIFRQLGGEAFFIACLRIAVGAMICFTTFMMAAVLLFKSMDSMDLFKEYFWQMAGVGALTGYVIALYVAYLQLEEPVEEPEQPEPELQQSPEIVTDGGLRILRFLISEP